MKDTTFIPAPTLSLRSLEMIAELVNQVQVPVGDPNFEAIAYDIISLKHELQAIADYETPIVASSVDPVDLTV